MVEALLISFFLSFALAADPAPPAAVPEAPPSPVATPPPPVDPAIATGAKGKKDAAVIVSMGDYASLPDVANAQEDAASFRDFLLKTRGLQSDRIKMVQDGTRDQISSAIHNMADATKGKGTLWIYFVGLGGTTTEGKRILLGSRASADDPASDAMPLAEVQSIVGSSRAGQVVVVVDASFGGWGRDGKQSLQMAPPETLATPSSERVSLWLAATGAEAAPLYEPVHHGLFTYLVLGSLRGWADGTLGAAADGKVSLQEAHQYVAKVYRQIGGPELKSSRESRGTPNGWILSAGTNLEAGPSKESLIVLAKEERVKRVTAAQARQRVIADADWATTLAAIEQPGADVAGLLKAFVARYDSVTATVDGAEVAVVIPQVAEARSRLDAMARQASGSKKKKRGSRKKVTAPPPAAPVVNPICQDVSGLQAIAAGGQMTDEQRQCIEERLSSEKVQTTKDKLSRLLLIDADVRGAEEEWLSLAQRHLEDIDRSDPDLCLKYALRLSHGGVEDAEEVLRWADVALENKQVWEGPLYMSRVYSLQRLKAETAARLWHEAEQDFIEERSEEKEVLAEKYRGIAKNFAREWLDYARSSGQPVDRAWLLCSAAAGNEAFCPASG